MSRLINYGWGVSIICVAIWLSLRWLFLGYWPLIWQTGSFLESGKWGVLLGTFIWDLGLFSNFMLLSISLFLAIWLSGNFGLSRTLGFASADVGPLCFDQLQAYHVQASLQDPSVSAHHVLGVVLLLLLLSYF